MCVLIVDTRQSEGGWLLLEICELLGEEDAHLMHSMY